MSVHQVGTPENPAAVSIPGGRTTLAFSAQDDAAESEIDVEYFVTGPSFVRFSNDTSPRLVGFTVGTSSTRVVKTAGFITTNGTLPDSIDVTADVRPRGGVAFQVDWSVPIQFAESADFVAAADRGIDAPANPDAWQEAVSLVRRLAELLPTLQKDVRARVQNSAALDSTTAQGAEKVRNKKTSQPNKPSAGKRKSR